MEDTSPLLVACLGVFLLLGVCRRQSGILNAKLNGHDAAFLPRVRFAEAEGCRMGSIAWLQPSSRWTVRKTRCSATGSRPCLVTGAHVLFFYVEASG